MSLKASLQPELPTTYSPGFFRNHFSVMHVGHLHWALLQQLEKNPRLQLRMAPHNPGIGSEHYHVAKS